MASTGEGVQTTETSFPREQLRVRIEDERGSCETDEIREWGL